MTVIQRLLVAGKGMARCQEYLLPYVDSQQEMDLLFYDSIYKFSTTR